MKIWRHPFLSALLTPFSWIFLCITSLRNYMYDIGLLKSFDVHPSIISIGNIAVGGTGKTPVTETIARALLKSGKTVAIQSRGYGRKSHGLVVVSDGRTLLSEPRLSGDEPLLLARNLPGVPVVVGNDRCGAVAYIRDMFHPDFILLDDAFQHRRIRRRTDIVTLDAAAPFGNGHLLPAGPLREKPAGLKRAHLIVLTRSNRPGPETEMTEQFKKWSMAKLVTSEHLPVEWINLSNGQTAELNRFEGTTALAFTGIGNPASFRNTLKSLNINIAGFLSYPDHYWYRSGDMKQIIKTAGQLQAEAILTTEKDGVRLKDPGDTKIPIYYLRIQCNLHMTETLNDLMKL